MKVSKKQGFTLVEIMIVVAIIGVLAAIAIPSFQRSRQTARANICVNNLRLIDSAYEQFLMASGSTEDPTEAQVQEYMRGGDMVECPENGAYTWVDGDASCGFAGHGSLAEYLDETAGTWTALGRAAAL